MKKIIILLMSFILILVGCSGSGLSESEINELESKTKVIAESYGLKDVGVEYREEEIGGAKNRYTIEFMIIQTSNMEELSMSLTTNEYRFSRNDEKIKREKDLVFFMEEDIKRLRPTLHNTVIIDKKSYYSPFTIRLDEGEISSKNGVWHYAISGKFKVEKSKKPNNSSKDDWYNEHPGDSDWKNVVDGLTELYGGDE